MKNKIKHKKYWIKSIRKIKLHKLKTTKKQYVDMLEVANSAKMNANFIDCNNMLLNMF